MTTDEAEFDVVVVGSGAAGMTAALAAAHHGLRTVVLEKTGYFGGSTARSGGGIWAPGNAVLRKAGVRRHPRAGQRLPGPRRRARLRRPGSGRCSPGARRCWRSCAPTPPSTSPGYPVTPTTTPRPRAGWRGGAASSRCRSTRRCSGPKAWLNPAYLPAPPGVTITQADYRWLSLGTRHPRAILTAARVSGRAVRSRLLKRRTLSMGQALAAGLRAGLAAQGVPVWLGTPMTGLQVTDGRVTGVEVTRDGRPALIRARRGVLIAAGGFERNEEMRRRYQRQPIGTEWTTGSAGNTGDGIVAGEAAGAALDLMDDAWWGPTIPLSGGPYFCLAERSLPGCILVNGAGQRFVNESAPYVDAVHAMYGAHSPDNPHIPAWLVTDQRYRNRYVFAGLPPRKPLPRRWYRAGAVFRAPTLTELAEQVGVDPEGLSKTVTRFNEFAEAGRDEDFRRGDSAYDRYYGDPRCRPNPNLAPLAQAPFYAVKIVPGDLGTKGGLRTDERARVLRPDGTAIAGLYAAGNASASVMGHSYAGAGATIGPAMTFGYIAALDLADADRETKP